MPRPRKPLDLDVVFQMLVDGYRMKQIVVVFDCGHNHLNTALRQYRSVMGCKTTLQAVVAWALRKQAAKEG